MSNFYYLHNGPVCQECAAKNYTKAQLKGDLIIVPGTADVNKVIKCCFCKKELDFPGTLPFTEITPEAVTIGNTEPVLTNVTHLKDVINTPTFATTEGETCSDTVTVTEKEWSLAIETKEEE